MQKQFASFNTFVSRQTLPYSSCDGLCTDQNDTAASVHLSGDIAVVCSKLSPTSHRKSPKRSGGRAWRSHANAQRTPVRWFSTHSKSYTCGKQHTQRQADHCELAALSAAPARNARCAGAAVSMRSATPQIRAVRCDLKEPAGHVAGPAQNAL